MTKKKFTPREIKFSELGMKVQDILVAVLWGEIANNYMHKHTSWLFGIVRAHPADYQMSQVGSLAEAALAAEAVLVVTALAVFSSGPAP